MNVPKLRFKEFNDEWKNFSLSELVNFSKGNILSKADLDNQGLYPCILYGQLYTKYTEVIRNVYSRTNRKDKNLITSKYGDILIPSSGETPIDISTASCIMLDNIILGGDINILSPKNCDGRFLSYMINNNKRKEIAKVAQGHSVVHLYNDNLKKIHINTPQLNEQKKIANTLELLDKKIELQTKKIEDLKLFKLALQKNIYGAIKDKIKLEDVGCFISGYGFPEKYQGHKNYSIPFYKVSDMNNFGNEFYMNTANNTLSIEICSDLKLKPICYRSIIFAKIGAAIMLDRKRIATPPFLIDNNMMSYYINKNDVDFDYIFYFLDSIKFSHYIQQGALPSLSSGDLGKIKIPFVNMKKQKTIGTIFNLYTKKIILETEKLNKLQQLKKGLMQSMFV